MRIITLPESNSIEYLIIYNLSFSADCDKKCIIQQWDAIAYLEDNRQPIEVHYLQYRTGYCN